MKLSDGSLRPVWTKEQEDKYGKSKRNRTMANGKILGAGVATAPDGLLRAYFDVSAGLDAKGHLTLRRRWRAPI